MSRATKRKHVMKEVLEDDFDLPKSEQQIVRVTASRGNNLHEVEADNGESFLVSMPTKFRRNVWVKRGDFILVEPIVEGDKVKAEMVKVLSNEHIKYFKENNCWPSSFDKKQNSDTNDDSDLFVNTNRPPPIVMSSSDDSDSEEEEEEEKNEESGDED